MFRNGSLVTEECHLVVYDCVGYKVWGRGREKECVYMCVWWVRERGRGERGWRVRGWEGEGGMGAGECPGTFEYTSGESIFFFKKQECKACYENNGSNEHTQTRHKGAGIARWWCVGLALLLDEASWVRSSSGENVFPVDGIFPLELTWVLTQGLVCVHMHPIARTQKILTFMS